MIESFRDQWLRDFHVNGTGNRNIPAQLERVLLRKLDLLGAATTEADLRVPPGNRYERLQGRLQEPCSIRVNGQYRLVFMWDAGRARDLYLDPHTYRG